MKKPIKCSAPKYIDYLMTWVQEQLDDETLFPSKIGEIVVSWLLSMYCTLLSHCFGPRSVLLLRTPFNVPIQFAKAFIPLMYRQSLPSVLGMSFDYGIVYDSDTAAPLPFYRNVELESLCKSDYCQKCFCYGEKTRVGNHLRSHIRQSPTVKVCKKL